MRKLHVLVDLSKHPVQARKPQRETNIKIKHVDPNKHKRMAILASIENIIDNSM
jgi:hypothetical protein